jgi:hypothetical protein
MRCARWSRVDTSRATGLGAARSHSRVFLWIHFGWEVAHAAVSRRPPISLDTIVTRTEGNTYDVTVWDLSLVQGPFSVAPCQTLIYDSQLLHRCSSCGFRASASDVRATSYGPRGVRPSFVRRRRRRFERTELNDGFKVDGREREGGGGGGAGGRCGARGGRRERTRAGAGARR